MDFNKCEEHKDYEEGIAYNEFMEYLTSEEGILDDYPCDIPPSDYGYAYCNECDKLIQVE